MRTWTGIRRGPVDHHLRYVDQSVMDLSRVYMFTGSAKLHSFTEGEGAGYTLPVKRLDTPSHLMLFLSSFTADCNLRQQNYELFHKE